MRIEASWMQLISLFQFQDLFVSNCNFKMCWQILYCSVCLADTPNDPADFFPLSVHYQERLSAAGRTRYWNLKNCCRHLCHCPWLHSQFDCVIYETLFYIFTDSSGGFFKREGKTKDHEVHYRSFDFCSTIMFVGCLDFLSYILRRFWFADW